MNKLHLLQNLAMIGVISGIGIMSSTPAQATIFTYTEPPDAPSTAPGSNTGITLAPNDDAILIGGFLDLPNADTTDVFSFSLSSFANHLGLSLQSSHIATQANLTFDLFSDVGLNNPLGSVSLKTPGGAAKNLFSSYNPGTYYARVIGSKDGKPDYSLQVEFNNTSVPEPSFLLGLIAISGLGLGLKPKNQFEKAS